MKDSILYLVPRKQGRSSEEQRLLRSELEETVRALDVAQRGFDMADDSDLVEFYLYETNALWARHRYLLRRIKEVETEQERGEV